MKTVDQAELEETSSSNDSKKGEDKARKVKEHILNVQTQGVKEKTVANASADMSAAVKQDMDKFFEWSPPPPPETMGEKLKRKVKQNPVVPVGKY